MKKAQVSGDDASASAEESVHQTNVACENDQRYLPLDLAKIKELGFKHCTVDMTRFYLAQT